ncbi:S8 family serine peptidase [Bacillus rubiinfantis]|uniref:S8 family serine peptidase n=1 Tax=Bacillus rubiinfantis TaxID=1499680 RepID=UPI0006939CD4|nr:S8 family serine peptidase [Bacillus rubiinfantis]
MRPKTIWSFCFFILFLSFTATAAQAEASSNQPEQIKPEVLFQDNQEFVDRELIVHYKPETDSQEQAKILKQVHAKEDSSILDGDFSIVRVPANADLKTIAKTLIKNKQVALVEPNYKFTKSYIPKEPYYQYQWYLSKIQMPKAWDKTKGSAKVTVAVIDDGVQQNHPDLKGKIVKPYNAVTGGSSYTPQFHATHVAGIIAASFNKKGVAGIAPNVKIMPINVFNGEEATAESVVRAIKYAADNHADIINMSLGGEGNNYAIEAAIKYARSKGVVVIAAAGNVEPSADKAEKYSLEYPAANEGVLGVSATTPGDKIADFSKRGKYIDFAAPGEDMLSCITTNNYYFLDGTSMAAPVVSGVAALVRSRNPFLTVGQVESILRRSTVDLGAKGWDSYYGYGRIDANKAVTKTSVPIYSITVPKTYKMTGKHKAAISFKTAGKGKISLTIKSTSGKLIRKVAVNKATSSSKFTLHWDGKNDSKNFVKSGTYKAEIKMTNGKVTVYKSTTFKVANQLKPAITLSGSYIFSPKASGKMTIPYTLTKKVKISAKIKSSSGKTVKTIINKKTVSAGKHTIVWNGKTTNGKSVNNGIYSLVMYIVDSHDKAGTPKKIQIKLDTHNPGVKFTTAPSLYKYDGKTNSTAKLELKETASLIVYVNNDKGTVIKRLINKQTQPGTVTISWNGKNDKNILVPEGNYYYYVQAKDAAKNITVANSARFILQDRRIPTIQASKDIYLRKAPTTIDYQLLKPGKVTIAISKGDTVVKTINTNASAGKNSFQWDGYNDLNQPVDDGDYQLKITVTDHYNVSQTFTGTVHVELTSNIISP